jgi:hypothetical protein
MTRSLPGADAFGMPDPASSPSTLSVRIDTVRVTP